MPGRAEGLDLIQHSRIDLHFGIGLPEGRVARRASRRLLSPSNVRPSLAAGIVRPFRPFNMIPLIASSLFTLLVLPAAALFWLTRRSPCQLLWGLKALAVGSYVGATFFLGGWYMLSYYGRYVLVGLFAAALVYGARRMRRWALWRRPAGWEWIGTALAILVLGLGVMALDCVSRAHRVPSTPVELTFPLHDRAFYVASGGSHALMNPHMKVGAPELRQWRGQLWGLDVVELYRWGQRAFGLYPKDLNRYAIFGTPVYAPCEGTVTAVQDTLPDLTPPARDTARKAGNYVMLRCGPDAYVLLAHLQQNSVRVEPGEQVSTKTRLGAVGNSGNSWEPHLHLSAQEATGRATLLDADPRPMTFDGKFPVRNDVFRGGSWGPDWLPDG